MHQDGKEAEAGLVYRLWEPAGSKASLVMVHGLGAHSGRWESLAEFLIFHNISSCAIDLKGFGLTKDLRGHIDSFGAYFDDIARLCQVVRKQHSNRKVFCVGESMGALLVFLLAQSRRAFCDGIILISPAFKTKVPLNVGDYLRVFWPILFDPDRPFDLPFTTNLITRDSDQRIKINTDPREAHVASSRLLTGIVFAQLRVAFLKNSIHLPVLFLLAGDDRIVESKSSKKIFEGLKCKDKELIEYDGMFHALSIDIDREKVFADILAWISKRL